MDSGTIRIIDVAFVGKNEDGEVVAFELTELDPDVAAGLERAGVEVGGLFNEDDLADAGEALEPGSSAALLVWENLWARRPRRRCATRAASSSRSSGSRTTSSRPHATGRSPRTDPNGTRGETDARKTRAGARTRCGDHGRGRGNGGSRLAPPAGEVRRPGRRAGAAVREPPPQPVYAEPAARAEPDYMAELEQLAQLKAQGIITDEEFEAKKKQLLGI